MPVRLLREGILTSERVDQLDAPAEVFYRRLMSKVDDHGLYDARPSILRASLYPLRVDRVREADITRWIAACEKAGVIALYTHDGKPYLQMLDTRWKVRAEAKFPLPENGCAQPQTPADLDVFGDVDEDEEKKPSRKRSGFDVEGMELPPWLKREVWALWAQDRKVRGKAMTEAAARLSIKKLEEYRQAGHDPQVVIEHSIANGYQGLYAPGRNGSQVTAAPAHKDVEQTRALLDQYERTPEEKAAAAAQARAIREQRGLRKEAA